jgi:YesN/AraC family two-component response regulator
MRTDKLIRLDDLSANIFNRKDGNTTTGKLTKAIPLSVRNRLFIQLLKDQASNFDSLYEILDYMGIEFHYEYFSVMVINIRQSEKQYNLKETVSSIINEAFKNKNDMVPYIIYLKSNRKIGVLLNIENGSSEESLKLIYRGANTIRNGMNCRFSSTVDIGIGNVYQGINGISRSYQEAAYCTDYRLTDSNSIVSYRQLKFDFEVYYPLNIEKKLTNCILAGNEKDASDLLMGIFQENFRCHNLPFEISKCLLFDIKSTVIKIVAEMSRDHSDDIYSNLLLKSGVLECETINEVYEAITDMIVSICIYINENKRSHNMDLLGEIYRHLNENYTNSTICIAEISQNVGVTPNYLSQFFKEQTEESIMVYINKMRINKAKEILKYSQDNLETIAKKVGYTNDAILIRAFKKLEGITPGQYRQACRRITE